MNQSVFRIRRLFGIAIKVNEVPLLPLSALLPGVYSDSHHNKWLCSRLVHPITDSFITESKNNYDSESTSLTLFFLFHYLDQQPRGRLQRDHRLAGGEFNLTFPWLDRWSPNCFCHHDYYCDFLALQWCLTSVDPPETIPLLSTCPPMVSRLEEPVLKSAAKFCRRS